MELKKCPFCEKEVEGYSDKHANYLMNQHILSKHSDKINFEEPEDGIRDKTS